MPLPILKKKAIINNLIFRARLIFFSKTIFYKELKNKKQTLINKGLPNYIVDEQIKRTIRNVSHTPTNKQTFIKLFTVTKCATIIN